MKKSITFFSFIILISGTHICNAQSGIITILAGNGAAGWSGDGGPATAAQVGVPNGMKFDDAGNLYYADSYNCVVRKISTAGVITTIAGSGIGGYSGDGGPATAARIHPKDVAIDMLGNVYIADDNNNVVRKVDASGIITTFAGDGTNFYSGDGGPATAAKTGRVTGVAVDAIGNLYLSGNNTNAVRKVNTSGIISTIAGNGISGYSGDGGPATSAQLSNPIGLAVDASNNIYIVDGGNYRVRKINSAGVISTIAGNGTIGFSGDGGPATAAQIRYPYFLTITGTGDVYISDAGNNDIRRINRVGIISTVAGNNIGGCAIGGPAITDSISPMSIASDQAMNIYFGSNCYHIDKFQSPPVIVSDSFSVYIDTVCSGFNIITVAHSSSPLNVKISFGDNSSALSPLLPTIGGSAAANTIHSYSHPGTYTIKMLLLNGTSPVDSVTFSYNYLMCNTCSVNFYYDANNNCIKDSAELLNYLPITTEVDSNGVAIDTISCTSGFSYTAYGSPGDIYSFRILYMPSGMFASCPSGGIITDTLQDQTYNAGAKNMALSCSPTSSFDLAEYVNTKCGRHAFVGDILVNNIYCNSVPATLSAHLDPKYNFQSAEPVPTSVAGNIITWDLSDVASILPQPHIHFICEVSGPLLYPGDTVNTDYIVTPTTGDLYPGNNHVISTDTVKSSFDPNEMLVAPEGFIASGTQLKYSIEFENTGNAPAQNIYVMDTLSDYVIPSSLRVLASSATMNTIPVRSGGHYILKFDFPGINLLDSSHHNECTGLVVFTINTRSGLPDGTIISNRAGIYFDDNDVVMTNTVYDVIGIPDAVTLANSNRKISVYPNPATSVLYIDAPRKVNVCVYDICGKMLLTQKSATNVSIQDLAKGMYIIKVYDEDNNLLKTDKFVKSE